MANIVALGSARFLEDDQAGATVILLMASMAMGWVFGPVMIGGVDETVDPTRLALLPLTSTDRYVVQLAAALSGTGPIAASVGLLLGLTFGHTALDASLLIVPLSAAVAILFMVGAARSLAALLAIAQRSRTGRDLAVLLAALVGGTMFTLAQLSRDVLGAGGGALLDVLSWLPFAWPARAINAARSGDVVVACGWLLISSIAMVLAHLLWIRLGNFLLLNGERVAQTRRSRRRALLSGASGEFGGALARQWVYLLRSPNSRVGFVFGTVFGIAFALVQIVQQGEGNSAAAAFGILLAMLANLGAATNVLGFDAGSLWLEVLAGGPSRANMIARQLIALPNLLLPTWVSGLIVGVWTGEWRLVALVCLLAVPVAFNVLSFGMVTSVVSPAPLPDWDNPFGNRQGNESRATRVAVIALGGVASAIGLSAPIFIVLFRSLREWYLWLVPLGGLVYAVTLFLLVSLWSGRYLRGREPKLIERLAPRALN
ncbi:MAG: hypothetical protein AAF567_25550 [Actinomycetota bacterium]